MHDWSLGRPNAVIYYLSIFFFGFEDILRVTESSYMIKGGIIIGLLVSDITTTTACIRIFGQMDTSDWIRFMSIASYTASGLTQF